MVKVVIINPHCKLGNRRNSFNINEVTLGYTRLQKYCNLGGQSIQPLRAENDAVTKVTLLFKSIQRIGGVGSPLWGKFWKSSVTFVTFGLFRPYVLESMVDRRLQIDPLEL